MDRDGEGRITATEILKRRAEMLLREKILGREPKIFIESYGDSKVLIRRVEWPWLRVVISFQTLQDHSLVIPPRFGLTYFEYDRDVWHYHLFPFNFVIALSRRVYQVFAWELPQQFADWERHWRKTHAAPEPEILVQSNQEGNGKPTQRSDSSPVE